MNEEPEETESILNGYPCYSDPALPANWEERMKDAKVVVLKGDWAEYWVRTHPDESPPEPK